MPLCEFKLAPPSSAASSAWLQVQEFPNQETGTEGARLGDNNGYLANSSPLARQSAAPSLRAVHEQTQGHRLSADRRRCLRLRHCARLAGFVGRFARVGGDIVCRCPLPQTCDCATAFQLPDRSRDPADGARGGRRDLPVQAGRLRASMRGARCVMLQATSVKGCQQAGRVHGAWLL
jgi:hypothetical protein